MNWFVKERESLKICGGLSTVKKLFIGAASSRFTFGQRAGCLCGNYSEVT
jgi:hypothetical protein